MIEVDNIRYDVNLTNQADDAAFNADYSSNGELTHTMGYNLVFSFDQNEGSFPNIFAFDSHEKLAMAILKSPTMKNVMSCNLLD